MAGTSLGRGISLAPPRGLLKDGTADNEGVHRDYMAGPTLTAIHPWLIKVQSLVRENFCWTEESDVESIKSVITSCEEELLIPQWLESSRQQALLAVQNKLVQSQRPIVVIGAAVTIAEMEAITENPHLVACDGAVGVIDAANPLLWEDLDLLVSDADGWPYIGQASERGVTIALHAHGDNINALTYSLGKWREQEIPPPLFLTHQTTISLQGAINPGGFTDGDRAICLLLSMGIHKNRIKLVGFNTKEIGRWSAVTVKDLKHKKLLWMEKILTFLKIEGV